MKRSLQAAVAVATLIAGTGLAIAQKQEGPAGKTEAPARAPAAIQNAPADKMAPAGPIAPNKASETKADVKSSGGMTALTAEQKTKIRSSVLTASAPRVTSVNFSLNIGAAVPRTVRVVAVPSALIEVHPAWRGFMYFVHGDEIVIVEPGTLKIVAIIEV